MTFRGFIRQHFHYGRGAFAYHRVRAARRLGRFRVEPLAFYSRLAAMPFATEPPTPSWSRLSWPWHKPRTRWDSSLKLKNSLPSCDSCLSPANRPHESVGPRVAAAGMTRARADSLEADRYVAA